MRSSPAIATAPTAARGGCGTLRPSRVSRWRALVLVLVHVAMVGHFLQWWYGGRTLSPIEPSEAQHTLGNGYVNAGFLLLTASVLSTLVLGRWFCGWLCHVVGIQDLCAWLLARIGLRPRAVRSRLLVWAPLLVALYMFAWPPFLRLWRGLGLPQLENHLMTTDYWATFPGPVVATLTVLLCGGLMVWWLGAKGFCTYGCPYGAVFGAVDPLAPGRILVTAACEGCGHCTAVCTSNVRVHEEIKLYQAVVDPGCMKCLDCVSVCPKDALYFGFGAPALGRRPKTPRPARRYDFSWPEELLMVAVGLAAFFLFRGLYHLVPVLFAVGLGVMTALAVVTAWRLLRQPDVAFQHARLRRGARVTRSGLVAWALCLGWLLFTAHSGVVHWQTAAGERLLNEAETLREVAARSDLVQRADAHLAQAERLGLFPDAELQYCRGQVARWNKDYPEAERRFRRATALLPRHRGALLALATVVLIQRPTDLDGAEAPLRQLLEYAPEDAEAQRNLGILEARRPR